MIQTDPAPVREIWPLLALCLVAALPLLPTLGWSVFAGVGAVLLFAAYPARQRLQAAPAQANAVLAPADGRIIKIEKVHDPYADRAALRISVFMGGFRGQGNRASVGGVVQQVLYFPGRIFNLRLDQAAAGNERNALIINTCNGNTVTLVQVAGLIARRILCYARPGDVLLRGQRFGFIRFGSRMEVYLPTTAVPHVAPGDRVLATATVLASL